MSDCLVTSGGSAPFEAMLLNTPSIIFLNDAQFSHNPMQEYQEAAFFVWNEETMLEAINSMQDKILLKEMKNYWENPLTDMFNNFSSNPIENIKLSLESGMYD